MIRAKSYERTSYDVVTVRDEDHAVHHYVVAKVVGWTRRATTVTITSTAGHQDVRFRAVEDADAFDQMLVVAVSEKDKPTTPDPAREPVFSGKVVEAKPGHVCVQADRFTEQLPPIGCRVHAYTVCTS